MKSISKILTVLSILLSSIAGFAQTAGAKTETVKVFGNCAMCKEMIENAGNDKRGAKVEWNKDSKLATLTYNSEKITADEVLKKIALAGYDNEKFLAPDEAYSKLPECCKYKRELKSDEMPASSKMDMQMDHGKHNHDGMTSDAEQATQKKSELDAVFDNYFSVKDALANDNSALAATKASDLINAIKAVQMGKLSTAEHNVWMKLMGSMQSNAEGISKTKDISKQRQAFMQLSKPLYDLAKASKQHAPVYYQHCPMFNDGKGADWLSRESAVRNPYYGKKMSTCGSTTETIK